MSYRRGLVSIMLVFTLVLSLISVAMPVLTSAVISHPGGTIVEVDTGENFTLRHRLAWDEPGVPGYYLVSMYWDHINELGQPDNAHHFTIVSYTTYFDNDGDNLPDPGVALIDNTIVGPSDNGTRYAFGVKNAVGDNRLGTFNVDIVLRAAGPDGTPHAPTDNHPIVYSIVQSLESFPPSAAAPLVTVRVLGRDVAVSISPSYQSGPPGTTLSYSVTVTNTGTFDDTYDLTISDSENWSATISLASLKLASGATGDAKLSVVVPPDAGENASMTVVAKATSTGDPTVSNSGTCETVARGETPEEPSPTAWPAALAVLIAVIILVGSYVLYSTSKAGQRKRRRTLRA